MLWGHFQSNARNCGIKPSVGHEGQPTLMTGWVYLPRCPIGHVSKGELADSRSRWPGVRDLGHSSRVAGPRRLSDKSIYEFHSHIFPRLASQHGKHYYLIYIANMSFNTSCKTCNKLYQGRMISNTGGLYHRWSLSRVVFITGGLYHIIWLTTSELYSPPIYIANMSFRTRLQWRNEVHQGRLLSNTGGLYHRWSLSQYLTDNEWIVLTSRI